jgi:hypothetical protein
MRDESENKMMHERLLADAKQAIITENKFCAMESLP